MTVITRVQLHDDAVVDDWDDAMRERMSTAERADGWLAGYVLEPVGSPRRRVIVGMWESEDHWKSWHDDPTFRETRRRLDDLGVDDGDTLWHRPVYQSAL